MTISELRLKAEQGMHLGVGRGTDHGQRTLRYVPASTLKGALGAAWLRGQGGRSVADLVPLLDGVTISDAVPVAPGTRWRAMVLPLDQQYCKYAEPGCPPAHDWDVAECPSCRRPPEQSKGQRGVSSGVSIETVTRVALNEQEAPRDELLYQREMLDAGALDLVALVAGDLSPLAAPGTRLRIGAASSVSGSAVVTGSAQLGTEESGWTLPAGDNMLRIELITPGVFVDDFGFPTSLPTVEQVVSTLLLPADAQVEVERRFTRWGRASGWNLAVNVPKIEDACVIAHSVYHVRVGLTAAAYVPHFAARLGLRSDEGCGWIRVEEMSGRA